MPPLSKRCYPMVRPSNVLIDFNDTTSGNRIALSNTNLSALQKIATVQTYATALGTPTVGTTFKVSRSPPALRSEL
jgi:hypothetical protein